MKREVSEFHAGMLLTLVIPLAGFLIPKRDPRARQVIVPACSECAELHRSEANVDRLFLGIRILTAVAFVVYGSSMAPQPPGTHLDFIGRIILASLMLLISERLARWLQRPAFDLELADGRDTFVFKNRQYGSRFADANSRRRGHEIGKDRPDVLGDVSMLPTRSVPTP